MANERTARAIFAQLSAQTRLLWDDADAERQRPALELTAEEIALVSGYPLPPDVEPTFFTSGGQS